MCSDFIINQERNMNKRAEFYSVSPKMMQILLEQEQQLSRQMRDS
ncbi:MAG: hypothetical protein ACI9ES_003419, partial [Oceanospirillaceae bacterium]